MNRVDRVREEIETRREDEIDSEVTAMLTSMFLRKVKRAAEHILPVLQKDRPDIADVQDTLRNSDDPVQVAVLAGYIWAHSAPDSEE